MPVTTTWKIAGATTVALGTLGAFAAGSGGIELHDRVEAIDLAGAKAPKDSAVDTIAVDLSPESADSPAESPFESPASPADTPGDPDWVDPSPESVDSPAPAPRSGGGGGGDRPDSPESPD